MKISRIFNVLMALFLIAAAMANVQPVAAQQNSQSHRAVSPDALYVPGEVIVGFTTGQSASAYAAQATALAGEVSAQVVGLTGNTALLSFAEDADVAALSAQLASSAGVAYAEPNYIAWTPEASPYALSTASAQTASSANGKVYRTNANGVRVAINKSDFAGMRSIHVRGLNVPTYPVEWDYASTWGWDEINANVIWPNASGTGAVCILDTGVDTGLITGDLFGKVLAQKDFVWDDLIAEDGDGHGTHVAGIIAADALNKKGISGVFNGKIVVAKVLDAQGNGNVFDIIQALNYCGTNASVKVINMSLGIGPIADTALFNALETAIVTKGKFVVASAGNDSTSVKNYPAAWAGSFVCKDGTGSVGAGTCATNTIDQGMVAVGAANAYDSLDYDGNIDTVLNVDTDNALGTNFEPQMCLTDFSNYGKWVEIIAPGASIFSTQPFGTETVTTPAGTLSGYEYMWGTSQAAPFVSGAVARMLSVFPLLKNTSTAFVPGLGNVTIKDQLLASGKSLSASLGVDIDPGVDETIGYLSTYDSEIPYCVPEIGGNYTNEQDMSTAVYLDVAAAMDRTSAVVYVRDALTGRPLTGATVTATQGTLVKDTVIVGKYDSAVDLINLPMHVMPTTPVLFGAPVNNIIKVTKTGYALSAVIGLIAPTGLYDTNEQMLVSIPPTGTGKMTLVADWDLDFVGGIDLDLFTFLPSAATKPLTGNAGTASLFATAAVGGVYGGDLSALSTSQKARWNRDGGNVNIENGNPEIDGIGTESVTMVAATSTPYWNTTFPGGTYEFWMTDYGASGDLMRTDLTNGVGSIVVRLWRAGVPVSAGVAPFPVVTTSPYVYTLDTFDCNSDGANDLIGTAGNNGDNQWLKLAHITGGTFTIDESCGIGDTPGVSGNNPAGAFPYSNSRATSSSH